MPQSEFLAAMERKRAASAAVACVQTLAWSACCASICYQANDGIAYT